MTPPPGASTTAARAPREHPAGGPAPAAPATKEGWTRAAIRADIADVRRRCAELGQGDELTALQQPRPGAVFGPAAASWLAIFGAWWCVVGVSPALWPLALVIVASRQRVLGNALHDATHGNGARSTRLNQWLLAVPMFEDFEHYRRDHLSHHAHLGDAALDPDYLAPTDGARPGALALYVRAALTPRRWRDNALGQLPGLSWAARGRAALWWACLLSGVAGLGAALGLGASTALTFAGLWLLARASTYHLLKVFTELSDHAGLEPGSILSNTRNSPANWLSALLHPHADNYHLAHHLAPRVPTSRLPALHTLLLGVEAYRAGHHCDGYFLGRAPVVRGWCRAGEADATASAGERSGSGQAEAGAGPVVRCRGLVKRYADVVAVDGLDLTVAKGECFGLLGPNGAGKTTTLEILEGMLEPTAGEVEILGRRWATDEAWLRERLGQSFQDTHLPARLTVRETVALFQSLYARGRDVDALVELVSLGEKADAYYDALSGGQRQRLAVACALAGDPELLFLDEPTTGLDPQSRRMLWDIILAFKAAGGCVVLTTHYMDEAERLCDRIGVVDHGRMIALGTPSDLIASLGGSQIIELALDPAGPPAADLTRALGDVPGVSDAHARGDSVALTVTDLHIALPGVLDHLRARGAAMKGVTVHRTTLEDVFVRLTGRALRE